MNVYLDDWQSAVKFMLDQVINISNLLYMGGDFNIRDAEWDLFVSVHPAAGQALIDLADSLGLVCSLPVLPVPIHYLDTDGHTNSVIDLIFLGMSASQVLYRIEPHLRLPLDYAPLLVSLSISPENICFSKKVLKCDSDEESAFLSSVNMGLCTLNFLDLSLVASLDSLSEAVSRVFTNAWEANARSITVTTRSKEQQNDKCRSTLESYRRTGAREDQCLFCSATRCAKQSFFDNRIAEIVSANKCPQDLMSWVKQCKLPAVEAIWYQGLPCNSFPDLWHALYWSYNAAANHSVQLDILGDVPCLASQSQISFSMLELNKALKACSNIFAPGSDHTTWCYLKSILANDICAASILSLANSCITL